MAHPIKRAGYRFVASIVLKRMLSDAKRVIKPVTNHETVLTVPASRSAAAVFHSIYPPESFVLSRPANFSDADWRAFQTRNVSDIPESFVVELAGASVIGPDGWVQDSSGRFIDDIWSERGFPTASLVPKRPAVPRPQRLDGTSVCLAMPWMPNYYHWTLQIVPRIHLLSRLMDPRTIDHWILPPRLSGYMRDWLDLLEIPEAKFVLATDDALICERLFIPSIPAPNRWIPAWVATYVRDETAKWVRENRPRRRIYVTRDAGEKRRVLNQVELNGVISRAGLEVVSMSGLSVRQQVELFESADLVVSVLGAALTNLVYCRPGTRVVEIIPKNLTFPAYYKLAQAVDLDYHAVVGSEPRVPAPFYTTDPSADVVVPASLLENLLVN